MQAPITLDVLAAVVSVVAVIIAVWWVVDEKINKVRETAAKAVAQAQAETAAVAKELAAYKLHVAETYMSKVAGGAAIDRATFAIEKIGADMKAELEKVETSVVGRIERMENRVFAGTGPPAKG